MDLNEKNIRAAQPGDVLRDQSIKGLHLRCFAGRKSFYLYFRTKAGVERKPKIGDYGSITLAQARKLAQDLWVDIGGGRDPSQARADARAEPSMQELWNEYWKRHGSKKKSAKDDDWQWRLRIEPKFGSRKLSSIGYTDIDDFHKDYPGATGNRTLALLSKMFNFAHRPLKWLPNDNPCKGVARHAEVKRKRYMRGEEPAKIAELLDAAAKDSPASVAFIYLLILTGARKGEIAAARWDWLSGNVLSLPDSKTGEKQIYLPQAAMDVLARLPQTHGTITGIVSPQKIWVRIRKEAGCPDLRLHDLRHSFASAAISAGLSLAQIGELLGHKNTQTTKRYAHLVEEAQVSAATAAADNLMSRLRPAKIS